MKGIRLAGKGTDARRLSGVDKIIGYFCWMPCNKGGCFVVMATTSSPANKTIYLQIPYYFIYTRGCQWVWLPGGDEGMLFEVVLVARDGVGLNPTSSNIPSSPLWELEAGDSGELIFAPSRLPSRVPAGELEAGWVVGLNPASPSLPLSSLVNTSSTLCALSRAPALHSLTFSTILVKFEYSPPVADVATSLTPIPRSIPSLEGASSVGYFRLLFTSSGCLGLDSSLFNFSLLIHKSFPVEIHYSCSTLTMPPDLSGLSSTGSFPAAADL